VYYRAMNEFAKSQRIHDRGVALFLSRAAHAGYSARQMDDGLVNLEGKIVHVQVACQSDGFTALNPQVWVVDGIAQVRLGVDDGGPASREHTEIVVIDPTDAWAQVPGNPILQAGWDKYHWPRRTRALEEVLTPHTASEIRDLTDILAAV
jgi:hypothetical protein